MAHSPDPLYIDLTKARRLNKILYELQKDDLTIIVYVPEGSTNGHLTSNPTSDLRSVINEKKPRTAKSNYKHWTDEQLDILKKYIVLHPKDYGTWAGPKIGKTPSSCTAQATHVRATAAWMKVDMSVVKIADIKKYKTYLRQKEAKNV